jgi:hypothetical protein
LPGGDNEATVLIQLKLIMDRVVGFRTQFLRQMVDFCGDEIGIPIQLTIIRLIMVNIIPFERNSKVTLEWDITSRIFRLTIGLG